MKTLFLLPAFLIAMCISSIGWAQEPEDKRIAETHDGHEGHLRVLKGKLTVVTQNYEMEGAEVTSSNLNYSYEHSSEAIYRDGINLIPRSYFNVDLGKGIWQGEAAAPDVRVWGSWMVGLNAVRQMKVSNHFYVKGIAGFHFHNFKFANDNIQALRGPETVEFLERTNGIKSKVAASYLTLAIVPKLSTGHNGFRLGVGPYAGYRLGGRGKYVYREGGRQKDFDTSDMYLQNLRYGLRAEVGLSWLDFFFNYDMNNVFESNRGPEVNAMSFGIIL